MRTKFQSEELKGIAHLSTWDDNIKTDLKERSCGLLYSMT